jgi:hypothetical protein
MLKSLVEPLNVVVAGSFLEPARKRPVDLAPSYG